MKESDNITKNFIKLFMEHQKTIYSYIFSLVYNSDAAEDILQETATAMWEMYSDFEPGTNFGAWGVTIAKYRVYEYVKKKHSKQVSMSDKLLEQISECAITKINNIGNHTKALHKCLEKLNDKDRKLLEIRYYEKVKVKDMAVRVNRPVQGLYQAMSRIHNILYKCIQNTLRQWEGEVW